VEPRQQKSHLQRLEAFYAELVCTRFVHDREHCYDVLVLRLRDELGDDTDVIKGSLGVGVAHRTIQPSDISATSGVSPGVLRAGSSMQIQVDANAIFARPFDGLQNVSMQSIEY